MAFFVPPVTVTFKLCTFSRRYNRFCIVVVDIINKFIVVVPFTCKHKTFFQFHMFQKRDGYSDVIPLLFCEEQIDWISVEIYNHMDLCAETTTAVPDLAGRTHFFASALCWYACTMKASIDSSSRFASRQNTFKILSNIPSSIYLWITFQYPFISGYPLIFL